MNDLAVKNRGEGPIRRTILYIVIALAAIYVIVSFAEIENIVNSLREGNWIFLLVGLIFEVLCLINNSVTYRSIYTLLGLSEERNQLFLISSASVFVSVVAPSGGISGLTVFIDAAKKRGHSPARVLVAGILYTIYEYVSLLCVSAFGFIVLIRRNNLSGGEMTAAGLLLLISIVYIAILYLGNKSSTMLGNILAAISRWVNRLLFRFLHHDLINPEKATLFADEIGEGIGTIRENKKGLAWPFLFALNNKACQLCVLTATFLAMDTPFSAGTIVGGFSMSQLIFYVSPTPGGVGFVESVFPAILRMLGVPIEKGLLITLTYRALTLWFSFLVGFFSFRHLQKKQGA